MASPQPAAGRDRIYEGLSRIDVLFTSVRAMKVRTEYDSLRIRCATGDERERILADVGQGVGTRRVFVLETADGLDHVIAGAMGWREDDDSDAAPSALAFFPPGTHPERILPF